MPRRARLSSNSVMVAAAVVAVATFGLGFLLAYDPGPTVESALPTTTTGPAASTSTPRSVAPTTATAPVSTAVVPTTVPTTIAPVVTTAVVVPTTAVPEPTTPPTTVAPKPGHLEVSYPRDGGGRMLLVAGGAAAIIVRNTGGSDISFSVEGAGAVTVGANGVANGVLTPGEGRAIPVVAGTDPPPGPGPHATIAVFSSAGLVKSIPVVIA